MINGNELRLSRSGQVPMINASEIRLPRSGQGWLDSGRILRDVGNRIREDGIGEQYSGRSRVANPYLDFVAQDFAAFWRWCPAPTDGLHRCGLLVKLFDYCGLVGKECKQAYKVMRLDRMLFNLSVVETEGIQAHQRVSHEAFVQNTRLRDAVARNANVRALWEHRSSSLHQRQPRLQAIGSGPKSPLALWVLSIVSEEDFKD
eukprot:TRINITY_DN65062_c0_g1_i1.p1 TRINITY_DN65062_c0_g1~~TRINITY_DN65062_c0_g1_i1.p1  ORF type:complete len:230 (-),score=28.09 TRINITY_DN65062_c0_g1_i1:191-799(-)